jgi:hypothetical protein
MQCLEVSCAVRSIYGSLGAKGLIIINNFGKTHMIHFMLCTSTNVPTLQQADGFEK